MKKMEKNGKEEEIDLKHDNMEFSANHDGEDILDSDLKDLDDDNISAEELDFLGSDDIMAKALALNEVELEAEVSGLPEEDWTDDLSDDEDENFE